MAGLEELKKKLQPLFDAEIGPYAEMSVDPCESYMMSSEGTVNLLSKSCGVYNFSEHGLEKHTNGIVHDIDRSEQAYRCSSNEMHVFGAIGCGSSSIVYKAIHITIHRILALKRINVFEKEKRQQLLNEITTLCEAPCFQGLVEFRGAFYTPDSGNISIALEYVDGGSFADVLRLRKSIPEPVLSHMVHRLLISLGYLHGERHLVHRDIKPANLLINLKGETKISDFGISAALDNSVAMCETFAGTVTYMSPERIQNESYSFAADIWSFGVTMFECATGKFPYSASEGAVNLRLQILYDPSPSPPRDKFSPEFCSFIDACLHKDPSTRPRADEVTFFCVDVRGVGPFVRLHQSMAPSLVRARTLISRTARNLFFPPHLPPLLPSAPHSASSFGLHSFTFLSESHSETNLNPTAVYRALSQAEDSLETLSREQRDTLDAIYRSFAKSTWISSEYLSYIPASFFQTAATQFRRFLIRRCNLHVFHKLSSLGTSPEADRFIFPIFIDFCLDEFPNKISSYKPLMESTDMTEPHTWFPFARAMKRKIFYHCGPANSGKTYSALQSFMGAKKGVYCSPLRLLAVEVFNKVNRSGVYCNLSTGQEMEAVPFSNHVACTIEMVSTDEFYDVAVIDDIQLMADSTRGYSWTKAFLGLMADELHLCGDPSVLNIVTKICKKTGDELHVQQYDSFKPLVVEAKTLLGDLKNVQSGDCILAFSRRKIFEVKLAIEKLTEHKCCVIYGALPPETRRQQVNLFNDQDTEYDVLVASDAVGMGLNLNIRRVVFYSVSKHNGEKTVLVSASQVKQIAGRAGRRGSLYPHGLVTTFNLDDLDYLIACLKQSLAEVTKVGIFPIFKQIELYAAQFSGISFFRLLDNFEKTCRLNGSYFLCQYQSVKKVAHMLQKVKDLSLEEQYNFCSAPVNVRDPKAMLHLLHFAEHYSKHRLVDISVVLPKCSARNDQELLDLETKHAVLSMYVSLSYHFKKETFPQVQKAKKMAADIDVLLGMSLEDTYWRPESRSQGKAKK